MRLRTAILLMLLGVASLVAAARADDQTVIVAEGNVLPKVKVGDLVRLTASSAAGRSDTSVTVEGPAKLVSTTQVRKFVDGKPLIGAVTKEFLIQAEKPGVAKITIATADVVEKKTTKKEYKLEIE